jgi:hypothetical protein
MKLEGTYLFATKAGEDYTKTIGEGNVLELVVKVV